MHWHGSRTQAGLGWAGLGWAGLGWAGLGWAGLGWASTHGQVGPASHTCSELMTFDVSDVSVRRAAVTQPWIDTSMSIRKKRPESVSYSTHSHEWLQNILH